jgi:transcriptional regulator with GAF, ATPase, and Fis domain
MLPGTSHALNKTYAEARLVAYEWPGNVRELENHIKHRVLSGSAALKPEASTRNGHAPLWRRLSGSEKHQRLLDALASNGGNVTAAARQLGISRHSEVSPQITNGVNQARNRPQISICTGRAQPYVSALVEGQRLPRQFGQRRAIHAT